MTKTKYKKKRTIPKELKLKQKSKKKKKEEKRHAPRIAQSSNWKKKKRKEKKKSIASWGKALDRGNSPSNTRQPVGRSPGFPPCVFVRRQRAESLRILVIPSHPWKGGFAAWRREDRDREG